MNYDVAIVGGGLVGSTLACALSDQKLAVAVIETRAPDPPPSASLDPRVSAITRASERILRALDVWSQIPPDHIGTFRRMHVWDLRVVAKSDLTQRRSPSRHSATSSRTSAYSTLLPGVSPSANQY